MTNPITDLLYATYRYNYGLGMSRDQLQRVLEIDNEVEHALFARYRLERMQNGGPMTTRREAIDNTINACRDIRSLAIQLRNREQQS